MGEDVGEHAASYAPLNAGNVAKPSSGNEAYTRLICADCGFGEVLGPMIVGCTLQCFFIRGQLLLGLGGSDSCPAANTGCDMYKPEGDCNASIKLLCPKMGIDCPAKPWI